MKSALPVAFKIDSAASRYLYIYLTSLEIMYGGVEQRCDFAIDMEKNALISLEAINR
jgi:hypothetical protein